ncbi:diacylglycerol kinase 7-like isoform X1 [Lycium barbarum]|uniref:diacylglycerol kinase 7-like isoform X1 n=1 Tax=Lycium barbarum TaxID=112863 RepID=UPI00293F189C|nr:diacylglycerol kinase 7-like isoform X1 [Lycium barbarum]
MGSSELTTTNLSLSSTTASSTRSSSSSSVIDSIWGCTGSTIHKEDLRKRITIPEYLRVAMREAIINKDVDSVKRHYDMAYADGSETPIASESPIVVFINAKSGGRHGPELKARLQDLMGEEQLGSSEYFWSSLSNATKLQRVTLNLVDTEHQQEIEEDFGDSSFMYCMVNLAIQK